MPAGVRTPRAKSERPRHHRALREAAEHRALDAQLVGFEERVQPAAGELGRWQKRAGIREADPHHLIPVCASRRKRQRPAGKHHHQPALGVEHIGQRSQIVLVGAATVKQHQRPIRNPVGGAHAMGEAIGHDRSMPDRCRC